MKKKSGKFGVAKAAMLLLIVMVTVQTGFGQLIGFYGKLPDRKHRNKYKCEHIGVQKVKHIKKRLSKEEISVIVLNKKEEDNVTVSVKNEEPIITEEKIEPVIPEKEEIKKPDSISTIRLLPQPVYFRYDSYRLDIVDLTQIALAVYYVKEGNTVTLIGHTDDWGSERYNELLSSKRANIIKDIMVQLGCNPELITAKGEGEKYPAHTNEHEEGRKNNRRVEFVVIFPK